MSSEDKKDRKLSILGYCRDNTSIVAEMACESLGIYNFDVVKNVEVDSNELLDAWEDLNFGIFMAEDYSSWQSTKSAFFFGVLDAHLKYIVYHVFYRDFGVSKDLYANLIHPTAYFSRSANNEPGLLMEPLTVVSAFSDIGFGVSVKRGSTVGHHSKISDFVSINPGVNISGRVHIGEGTTIGTGASIIHDISIGERSLIGAGSVVTKDIPDGVIAFGNPCKVIRENDRWHRVKEILGE